MVVTVEVGVVVVGVVVVVSVVVGLVRSQLGKSLTAAAVIARFSSSTFESHFSRTLSAPATEHPIAPVTSPIEI